MRAPALLMPARSPWLRYPLLGPPIGATAFALYMAALGVREVLAGGNDTVAGWLLQYLVFGWPIFMVFGYVFGVLPALLTGAVAAWLRPRGRGWPQVATLAAVGAALSYGASWLMGQDPGTATRMAACGAIAAAVCAATGDGGAAQRPAP
jgi:peptidoglycan/LPS O-acetylase OafA/YrhL